MLVVIKLNIRLHVHDRKNWTANPYISKKQTPFIHRSIQDLNLHRSSIVDIESKIKNIITKSSSFSKIFSCHDTYDDRNGLFGFEVRNIVTIITQFVESDNEDSSLTDMNVIQLMFNRV